MNTADYPEILFYQEKQKARVRHWQGMRKYPDEKAASVAYFSRLPEDRTAKALKRRILDGGDWSLYLAAKRYGILEEENTDYLSDLTPHQRSMQKLWDYAHPVKGAVDEGNGNGSEISLVELWYMMAEDRDMSAQEKLLQAFLPRAFEIAKEFGLVEPYGKFISDTQAFNGDDLMGEAVNAILNALYSWNVGLCINLEDYVEEEIRKAVHNERNNPLYNRYVSRSLNDPYNNKRKSGDTGGYIGKGGKKYNRLEDSLSADHVDDPAERFKRMQGLLEAALEREYPIPARALPDQSLFDHLFSRQEKESFSVELNSYAERTKLFPAQLKPFAVWIVGSMGHLGLARKEASDLNLLVFTESSPEKVREAMRLLQGRLGGKIEMRSSVEEVLQVGKNGDFSRVTFDAPDFAHFMERNKIGSRSRGYMTIEVVHLNGTPTASSRTLQRAYLHLAENLYRLGINAIGVTESEEGFSSRILQKLAPIAMDDPAEYAYFMHEYQLRFFTKQVIKVRRELDAYASSAIEPGSCWREFKTVSPLDAHLFINDEFGQAIRKIYNFGPKGLPTQASVIRRDLLIRSYPRISAQIRNLLGRVYEGMDVQRIGIAITMQGSTAKGMAIEPSDIELRIVINDSFLAASQLRDRYKKEIIKSALQLLNEEIINNHLPVRKFNLEYSRESKITFLSAVLRDSFRRKFFKPIADIFYINIGDIEPMRRKVLESIAAIERPVELWAKITAQWAQFLNILNNKHKDRLVFDVESPGFSISKLPDLRTMFKVFDISQPEPDPRLALETSLTIQSRSHITPFTSENSSSPLEGIGNFWYQPGGSLGRNDRLNVGGEQAQWLGARANNTVFKHPFEPWAIRLGRRIAPTFSDAALSARKMYQVFSGFYLQGLPVPEPQGIAVAEYDIGYYPCCLVSLVEGRDMWKITEERLLNEEERSGILGLVRLFIEKEFFMPDLDPTQVMYGRTALSGGKKSIYLTDPENVKPSVLGPQALCEHYSRKLARGFDIPVSAPELYEAVNTIAASPLQPKADRPTPEEPLFRFSFGKCTNPISVFRENSFWLKEGVANVATWFGDTFNIATNEILSPLRIQIETEIGLMGRESRQLVYYINAGQEKDIEFLVSSLAGQGIPKEYRKEAVYVVISNIDPIGMAKAEETLLKLKNKYLNILELDYVVISLNNRCNKSILEFVRDVRSMGGFQGIMCNVGGDIWAHHIVPEFPNMLKTGGWLQVDADDRFLQKMLWAPGGKKRFKKTIISRGNTLYLGLQGASPLMLQWDTSPIGLRNVPRLASEMSLFGACVGGKFGSRRIFPLNILDDRYIRNFLRYKYARP